MVHAMGAVVTVAELIEALKELPQDLRVVTRGYESGYCDIDGFDQLTLALGVNDEWYYGPHEQVSDWDKHEGHEHVAGVCL